MDRQGAMRMLSFHCRTWGRQCQSSSTGAAAGRLPPRPWSRTFPSPALETYFRKRDLASCNAKTFLKRAESSLWVDLTPAVGLCSQAQPVTCSLSQKRLQTSQCMRGCVLSRTCSKACNTIILEEKEKIQKEQQHAPLTSPPTTRHLVTRNFSPAIAIYQGTPCTLDKINITSEIALKARLDWETEFNLLLPWHTSEGPHLVPRGGRVSSWCQAKDRSKGKRLKWLCKSNWNWNFSLTCWEETHKLGQLEEAIITGYK